MHIGVHMCACVCSTKHVTNLCRYTKQFDHLTSCLIVVVVVVISLEDASDHTDRPPPTTGDAKYIVVEPGSGTDAADCGTQSQPCDSLSTALQRASEVTVITLQPTQRYDECQGSISVVNTDVTITTESDRVDIDCTGQGGFIEVHSGSLTLKKVMLTRGSIRLKDSNLKIDECTLEDVTIVPETSSNKVSVTVLHSHMRGTRNTCTSGITEPGCLASSWADFSAVPVNNVDVSIKYSSLEGSVWIFRATQMLTVEMDNVVSIGVMAPTSAHTKLRQGFEFVLTDGEAAVEVKNSTVQNNIMREDELAAKLHAAVILYQDGGSDRTESAGATFSFRNCYFVNNSRAVTSRVTSHLNLNFDDCVFENNRAQGHGAAILMTISEGDTINKLTGLTGLFENLPAFGLSGTDELNIRRSRFVGNRAEKFDPSVQSLLFEGAYTLGFGGAIYIDTMNLYVADCAFHDNSAEDTGGSIYSGPATVALIVDTILENSPEGRHAKDGDLLYATGSLSLSAVFFRMLSADSRVPLLTFDGEDLASAQFAQLETIDVLCPAGHQLILQNSTGAALTAFQHVRYSCSPCSEGFYSLDMGHLSLISGLSLSFTFLMEMNYTNVTCRKCPYGGYCRDGTVHALLGFWGYTEGDDIRFELCPSGYCCDQERCDSFDECADQRTGVLCGQCQADHSQAFADSQCLADEDCDDTWVWVLLAVYGLLYVAFFLLEAEWKPMLDRQYSSLKHHLIFGWTRFRESVLRLPKHQQAQQQQQIQPTEEPDNGGLEIFFYYVQTASLLSVSLVYDDDGNDYDDGGTSYVRRLTERITDVLGINVLSLGEVCVASGWDALAEQVMTGVFPFYLLLVLLALYGLVKIPSVFPSQSAPGRLCGGMKNCGCIGDGTASGVDIRFSLALFEVLLFTYQAVAEVVVTLIHCIDIGGESVLFIQGSVECFQPWQNFAIIICAAYVVPLFLVMGLGPGAVHKRIVPGWFFLLGCFIPPVFLAVLIVRWFMGRFTAESDFSKELAESAFGPFKQPATAAGSEMSKIKLGSLPICWEGVIIFRRLILVLVIMLVPNPVTRMFVANLLCLGILLTHIVVKPYAVHLSNVAECVTLTSLCVVSSINLIKAVFSGLTTIPAGPMVSVLEALDGIEFFLVAVIPALVVIVGVILVLIGLAVRCATRCPCRRTSGTNKPPGQTNTPPGTPTPGSAPTTPRATP